jgi:hypothetical protein
MLVSLAACSPQYIIRHTPLAAGTTWLSGKQYACYDDGVIRVSAASDGADGGYVVFTASINNKTIQPFTVDPAAFKYIFTEGIPGTPHADQKPAKGKIIYALDPEEKILDVERRTIDEKKSYDTDTGVNAAAGCLGLGAGVLADSKEEQKEVDKNFKELEESAHERELEHNQRMDEFRREKNMWSSEALRKTTLNPGQTITGKIYFPRRDKNGVIYLALPMGEWEAHFWFAQQLIDPSAR